VNQNRLEVGSLRKGLLICTYL